MSTETPVATATVNGVVATSVMSSREIFNMHLKAQGEAPIDFNAGGRIGPPLHVHSTNIGNGVVDVQAAVAKAPPSPTALERQNAMPPQGNPSAARQAELDAELQAKGIQTRPDGRRIANGEIDREGLELLTANFRVIAEGLRDNPQAVAGFKAAYEKDFKDILEGKQLTGAQIAALRKGANGGKAETVIPKTKEATPVSQHTPEAWAEGHKSVVNEHGMIPFDRINKAGLSGYVLPKVIADQHYSPEIFALLADARAEGLTQKMVDGMIKAEMKRAGWVKS